MSHSISICIFMTNLCFYRHHRFPSVKSGYERHDNECAALASQLHAVTKLEHQMCAEPKPTCADGSHNITFTISHSHLSHCHPLAFSLLPSCYITFTFLPPHLHTLVLLTYYSSHFTILLSLNIHTQTDQLCWQYIIIMWQENKPSTSHKCHTAVNSHCYTHWSIQ